MFKLIHNLTLAMVLYHSMVGCCCHHAHVAAGSTSRPSPGEEHAECRHAVAICSINSACGCGHSDPGAEPSHEAPPCSPRGCGTKCVFVVPGSGAAMAMPARDTMTTDFLCCATSSTVPTLAQYTERSAPLWASPPVRVHLRNQILLL